MQSKSSQFASPKRITSKLERDEFIEMLAEVGQNTHFSSSHLRLPNMDAFPWIVALTQPSTTNFSLFKTKKKILQNTNYWSLWGCVAAGQGKVSVEFCLENKTLLQVMASL